MGKMFIETRSFCSPYVSLIRKMKFSNIIKVSVGLGCGLGEVAIPARFDEGRNWIITASVPVLDSHVQVQLSLANRNWLSSFDEMPTVKIPWTLVGGDGVSSGHSYTYDSLTSATYVETHLGLHPESALLKGSGSVALIRASGDRLNREGKLVIGSSLPSFLATCVPGTYMQLNHRENNASVRFGDDIARPGKLDFHHSVGNDIFAGISQESLDGIKRALTRLGAIPSWEIYQHRNFLRCPEALVHSLPPLEVDVVHVGKISFDPVDYLTFDGNGGCRILVDTYWGNGFTLEPLRLNGFNLRITRNKTFEICRSGEPLSGESSISDGPLLPAVVPGALSSSKPSTAGRKLAIPVDFDAEAIKLMRTDESANTGEGVSVSAGPGVSSTTTVVPSEEENTTLLA